MIRSTTRSTRRSLLALPLILAPIFAVAAPIASAVSVTPAATAESERGTVTLARGASVEQNDLIATGPAGSTRLKFLDASFLDVGPGANVKLDEFVYSGNTAEKASLTMTKGTFRWVSGISKKEAYDLKTPLATIGIRGTDFRVITDEALTTIRLTSGAINACSRVSQTCATIDKRGQGVRLFADGRVEMFMEDPQAAPPVTRRAAAPPPPPSSGPRARPPVQRAEAPPPRRIIRREPPPQRVVSRRPPPVYEVEDEDVDYLPPPRRRPPVIIVDRPRPTNPCGNTRGARIYRPDCQTPPRGPYGDGGWGDGPRWPRPQGDWHRPPRGPYGDGGGRPRPPTRGDGGGMGGGKSGFGFGFR